MKSKFTSSIVGIFGTLLALVSFSCTDASYPTSVPVFQRVIQSGEDVELFKVMGKQATIRATGVGGDKPTAGVGTLVIGGPPSTENALQASRADGTSETDMSAVTTNMLLGRVALRGHNGSEFNPGAIMQATATQTWSPSARGTHFVIGTNLQNDNKITNRIRINPFGVTTFSGTGYQVELDNNNEAGASRLLLFDPDTGEWRRVRFGPANSAGPGYRILRVEN